MNVYTGTPTFQAGGLNWADHRPCARVSSHSLAHRRRRIGQRQDNAMNIVTWYTLHLNLE